MHVLQVIEEMQPTSTRWQMAVVGLRCPALLVALLVVHGDCTNITQIIFRIIQDVGCSNDSWPQILTDFPACFGTHLHPYNGCTLNISFESTFHWLSEGVL